jgi:hypothetical protein
MSWLRSTLVVAFDASSVAAARVSWSGRRPRVRAFARAALSAGAVVPSAVEANVRGQEEVVAALRRVASEVEVATSRACLVVPDGVARVVALEVPRGAEPREFARFRLGQALPYPTAEAIANVLRVAAGRYVAAAVRRSIVEGYEAAASAAGLRQERLELAPIAALQGLLHQAEGGAGVDMILGDAAVSLAAYDVKGSVRAFRSRLRDIGPDEPRYLGQEIDRTAAVAGIADAAPPRLRIVGAGAPDLIRAFSADGRPARPGWSAADGGAPVEAAEMAWLGAALG